MATERTPRAADTREKTAKRKPWSPPTRLDAPPAPEGYKHRWIRLESRGQDDKLNVNAKLREGWEFVRADEHPDFQAPTIEDGKLAGIIGSGGLALARIPIETVNERNAYYGNRTQDQMTAIDRDLMKESHPSMPIQKERRSQVEFGGKDASD